MSAVRCLAVEGVIGVGKTSLVHRLHADRGGVKFLELVEENPFLVGGFYQDMERYAFDTEVFFLLARFRQQRALRKALEETSDPIYTDYVFEKNSIFAELTLTDVDRAIWRRMFDALVPEITPPDLVIYLRTDIDTVLNRIRERNRSFERDITREYMCRLGEAYDAFFDGYPGELLTIDVSDLDFVRSEADFSAVKVLIDHKVGALEAGQQELELATGAQT